MFSLKPILLNKLDNFSYVESFRVVFVQEVGGYVAREEVGVLDDLLKKRCVVSNASDDVRVQSLFHSLESFFSGISISDKLRNHSIVVDGNFRAFFDA